MSPSSNSLQDIAGPDGTFAVVAIDQRNTLKRMYAAVGQPEVTDDELVSFKADVLGTLDNASAVLIDPSYGVPALARLGGRPPTGVLIAAEPSDRGTYGDEPRVTRDPVQDAAWVRAGGGHALKYLVQIRADRPAVPGEPDLAAEGLDVVREVIADCRAAGVPSVIENLIYPLPGEQLDPHRRAEAIIEAAVALDQLGPDLLKLEYPGSPQACRRLAASITTPVGGAVGRRRLRRVRRRAADLLRRRRRVRLHRRPRGVEGRRRDEPRRAPAVPGRRGQAPPRRLHRRDQGARPTVG